MIQRQELKAIGRLLKPHGINGEIVVLRDFDDLDLSGLRCVVLDMDGIFVPFFISGVRPKSSETDLVTFDDIEDESHAAQLCGKTLYALKDDVADLRGADAEEDFMSDDGFYADDLVGFSVVSDDRSLEGVIEDLDDSTVNYLFVIRTVEGKIVYVPVADEYIVDVDTDRKMLTLALPVGLLEL